MSYRLDRLKEISPADRGRFEADGFLIVERLLEAEHIQNLRSRFPLLFAGKFDTGVYPDEWYWREGMSLPDVTRHMANAWKADLTVANLGVVREYRSLRGRPLRLEWSTSRAGYHLVEGSEDEADRLSSRYVVHGFP